MNVALWIVQVLLALMFGAAGVMKTFMPLEEIGKSIPWVLDVSPALVRFIGISELAGALGLVLPAATRIRPGLTPLAAAGLGLVMVLAAGFHAMRGEWSAIATNAVILALALFVVWGRTQRHPIPPRP
jgi:uncharacterized membrane protein YphA (DoxX/SURF4 family)